MTPNDLHHSRPDMLPLRKADPQPARPDSSGCAQSTSGSVALAQVFSPVVVARPPPSLPRCAKMNGREWEIQKEKFVFLSISPSVVYRRRSNEMGRSSETEGEGMRLDHG